MVTEMKIPAMAKVAASGQVPDNQGWLKSLGSITDMSTISHRVLLAREISSVSLCIHHA